jgi:phage repressor protein C with HTH and peptisase S24 domain
MDDFGLNVFSWATKAKVDEAGVRRFLKGGTNSLRLDTIEKLASAVNMKSTDLIRETKMPQIPLVGYVGTGAEVFAIDENEKSSGLEMLDMPITSKVNIPAREIMAVRVKGDSMLPIIQDGWIIYYHAQNSIEKCLRKLCVVKIKNGSIFIKELRKGEKVGSYSLFSYNAREVENVQIEWAYPIISIEPV